MVFKYTISTKYITTGLCADGFYMKKTKKAALDDIKKNMVGFWDEKDFNSEIKILKKTREITSKTFLGVKGIEGKYIQRTISLQD